MESFQKTFADVIKCNIVALGLFPSPALTRREIAAIVYTNFKDSNAPQHALDSCQVLQTAPKDLFHDRCLNYVQNTYWCDYSESAKKYARTWRALSRKEREAVFKELNDAPWRADNKPRKPLDKVEDVGVSSHKRLS